MGDVKLQEAEEEGDKKDLKFEGLNEKREEEEEAHNDAEGVDGGFHGHVVDDEKVPAEVEVDEKVPAELDAEDKEALDDSDSDKDGNDNIKHHEDVKLQEVE